MNQDVIFLLAIAPIVGILMFASMARNHRAHLKSIKDYISYFFWPFQPRRMLIVREVDGTVRIFYDDEYEIIRSKNSYYVRTIYGEQYVMNVDPTKAAAVVSTYDARGPRGHPSPMGVMTRWVIAAAFMVFLVYSAMISVWFPPPKEVHGVLVPSEVNPWEAFPVTIIFIIVITWFIMNITRFSDKTIEYTTYVALGIEPPYEVLFPELSPDSKMSPAEILRAIGREVKNVVPESIKSIFEAAKEKVKSEDMALSLIHI